MFFLFSLQPLLEWLDGRDLRELPKWRASRVKAKLNEKSGVDLKSR